MSVTTAFDSSVTIGSDFLVSRDNKLILASGGASGITVTLYPASPGDNLSVTVQKTDNGAGAVVVQGLGAQVSLGSQGDAVYLVFEGAAWAVSSTSFGSGGGGGGTPGAPPLSVQGANADGSAFVGIPNFTFDPTLGDLILNAGLFVNSTDTLQFNDNSPLGIYFGEADTSGGSSITFDATGGGINNAGGGTGNGTLFFVTNSTFEIDAANFDLETPLQSIAIGPSFGGIQIGNNSTDGINIDATGNGVGTGPGTGPLDFFSAGGTTFTDKSSSGMTFYATAGPFMVNGQGGAEFIDDSSVGFGFLEAGSGGLTFDATGNGAGTGPGTGAWQAFSAGTMTFDDSFLSGGGSKLDLDATTPGVVTVSTILNSVGGFQINGVSFEPGAGYDNVTADSDGISEIDNTGALGITFDATGGGGGTGPGTGPLNFYSAQSISLVNIASTELLLKQQGDGQIQIFAQGTGGLVLDATGDGGGGGPGTGPWNAFSAGGITFQDNSPAGLVFTEINPTTGMFFLTFGSMEFQGDLGVSFAGATSNMDIDATVPGVVTVSTILNAVGGFEANGTPGISGSGSTMTGVTVVNGIITAATFT